VVPSVARLSVTRLVLRVYPVTLTFCKFSTKVKDNIQKTKNKKQPKRKRKEKKRKKKKINDTFQVQGT
jgi:hypothetical protein